MTLKHRTESSIGSAVKGYDGLVWKGWIVRRLKTGCTHGDYLCDFGCPDIPRFELIVCGQFIMPVSKDLIEIPMAFKGEDGREYSVACDSKTPFTKRPTWWSRIKMALGVI